MTQNAGETYIKNVNGKNKEYSIKFVKKKRTVTTYTAKGEIKEYPVDFTQYITRYKGEIKNRKIFKWVPFIKSYGEIAVQTIGWLSIFLGLIIFIEIFEILEYFISLNFGQSTLYLVAIIVPFTGVYTWSTGTFLLRRVKYVSATRCKRCYKNYAYEEREEPDIEEISTEDSYTISITRYWKCKYCGHIDSSESPEGIKTYKGTKQKPVKIMCEKCGKTELNSECRDPDVREENLGMTKIIITTRYYKCKYCGKLNTTEEKTESESSLFD